MKICPVCKIQYKDDEMLFCVNDGAPLIETKKPVEIPAAQAETEAEFVQPLPKSDEPVQPPSKIRVSFAEPPAESEKRRNTPTVFIAPTKQKNYKSLFIMLSVFLLLAVGAAIGAAFYYSSASRSEVARVNTNAQTNANAAPANSTANVSEVLPAQTNDNLNANVNQDIEANQNVNAKPSPRPSPSPSPSILNRNTNGNANQASANTNVNAAVPTSTPVSTQTPAVAAASPSPRSGVVVSGGIVNGLATSLPRPAYPPAARAVRASGAVNVQVTIDENGNVISAAAVSGHALLRPAAVQAARQARFQPTILSGRPVKATGIIVYNFSSEP